MSYDMGSAEIPVMESLAPWADGELEASWTPEGLQVVKALMERMGLNEGTARLWVVHGVLHPANPAEVERAFFLYGGGHEEMARFVDWEAYAACEVERGGLIPVEFQGRVCTVQPFLGISEGPPSR